MTPRTVPAIDSGELRARLLDGQELALLDVREEAPFGEAHVLYASCMPLGRLEILAPRMLPRRDVRIVVCDGGEGLAAHAARRLGHFGYGNVSVLDGGAPAWAAAGNELFSGVNVPSKAFGEIVEHDEGTPSVSANELQQALDAGEDLVVLDSRPLVEFHARCIPGGVCVPGAELAYRVHDLAPSPGTRVVVNCAGRTRSIIGAQSLINAGIANPVVALRNGTMGWHLAGHRLEEGSARQATTVSAEGRAAARAAAARVAERFGVRAVDRAAFDAWRDEAGERTLYVLDVRSPAEYERGHLPGTSCAPGGQLVQETDHFLPVQHARVVLVDDDGVRATMTASWLVQMGWESVAVLRDAFRGQTLERGPEPAPVLGLGDVPEAVLAGELAPARLAALLEEADTVVLDVGLSRAYRAGHVPGAWYGQRGRLAASIEALPAAGRLVLTSEDGVLARLTAEAAAALFPGAVHVLAGGNAGWVEAGLALVTGDPHLAVAADDVWLRPYEKDWGVEQAMADYLTWEVGLVAQVARDGTARFGAAR